MRKQRVFAMGDIHGADKALEQCLERSGFDRNIDTLIPLGDYADGWSGVYNVIEILMGIKQLLPIMGNHDDWFKEYIRHGIHPAEWAHGGKATRASYLRAIGKEDMVFDSSFSTVSALNREDIPEKHRWFFQNLMLYHKLKRNGKHFCFVHGGFDHDYPIHEHHPYSLMWDRTLWEQAKLFDNITFADGFTDVFIGHTHVDNFHYNSDAKPLTFNGVTNLDTGAGGNGKLTIMDIDTREYWQSDFVHTLYPDEFGRRKLENR